MNVPERQPELLSRAGLTRFQQQDRYMTWLQNAIPFIGIVLMCQRTATAMTPQQYHLINERLNWYEAQSFCRAKYTDLATVTNMDDKNRLLNMLGSPVKSSWIGLQRGGSRRWMWSDGSGVANFTMWSDGQPSGGGWCGELYTTGAWNDTSCGEARGCVCYDRQQDTKRGFVYYSQNQSWVTSQELCRNQHTDMASISTHDENLYMANSVKTWTRFIRRLNIVWIGLFNDAWIWSDGSGNSFRFWRGSSPGLGNCTSVSTYGRWVAADCNDKATFVCQGGLKVKKSVIRMKVRSDVNFADSAVSDELLKKLETGFKNQSVTLSWRSDRNGIVFQREAPMVVAKTTGC